MPAPTVVNQTTLSDIVGYGPTTVTLANTAGNALIAFLACGTSNPQNYLPRLTIGDDAHNWWIWAGDARAIVAGGNRRIDVWIAPNARRADTTLGTNVSVAASGFYTGFVGSIIEVANFPTYAAVDFVLAGPPGGGFGTSVNLTGTATTADYAFGAALVSGSGNSSLAITDPAGWTALTAANSGSTTADMSSQALAPAWNTVAAGAVSATWSWTGSFSDLAIVVGFKQVPPAPVQANPNWPSLKIEGAFGFQPGSNAGQGVPTWTDLTARAINEQGQAIIKAKRGRDFELSQPAAGETSILFNNQDGSLNPANASGPFFPNLVPETPIRTSATWQGRTYGISFVYASEWPQTFPDPQWGFVEFKGHDVISNASQGSMPSAYGGQVLNDIPYTYYALGDFFQLAHGQLFANTSRTNLKPLVGYSPGDGPQLQTGLTLGLQGDSATGIGISGLSSLNTTGTGCGAFVRDNGLPDIGTNFPATIELWFTSAYAGTLGMGTSGPQQQLLQLTALPTNYIGGSFGTQAPGQRFYIYYASNGTVGNSQIAWALEGPNGIASGFNFLAQLTDGALYHIVFTITYNGTQYLVTLWVNGVNRGTTNVAANSPLELTGMIAGSAQPLNGSGGNQNWTLGQVAFYPWALTSQRIQAHYKTGITADAGDPLLLRLGKLSSWSGLCVPLLGTPSPPTPLIGNADQIQGSALADALYALSVEEGGMFFAPADAVGAIWYTTRTSLYNRTPRYIFGDNGTTETPYDPGSGFDYSDKYLFNIVTAQRTISSSSTFLTQNGQEQAGVFNAYGVTATEEDLPSIAQYMPRGPLSLPVETTSDQDAYDRANWSLVKYKQPQLRANQIRLDPAGNASVWPVALAVEQGDIVTVNRRPLDGPMISLNCIVQQVEHTIGPDIWDVVLTLAPYFPENAVIQLDNPSFDQLQDGVLGW